jgi:hypothetical protein
MRTVRRFELVILVGWAVLAIVVQILVYGATKIRSGSPAPLSSWQPYFGWPYALAFLAAQLAYCYVGRRPRGYRFIAAVWALSAVLVVVTFLMGRPSQLTLSGMAALTAGVSGMVLGAAFYSDHLIGPDDDRPRRRRRRRRPDRVTS